jgi:molybdenum cofactor cytidylyltransferase
VAEKNQANARAFLAGVLLAAGSSRRLGRPKQLLIFKGAPLVVHAAKQALDFIDAGLIVVTGAAHDEVIGALEGLPVRAVYNPHWREGIGSSIRQGVATISADVGAILLMLCDQPAISPEDFDRLVRAWRHDPDRITAAGYGNGCGVPAIFPRRYREQLLTLTGDRGARQIIENSEKITVVDMPNAELDIDTPEHLKLIGA